MGVTNLLDDNTTFWSPYYNAVADASAGFGIISGCSISKGSGDWEIDVTAGEVFIDGTGTVSVSANGPTLTDPASDADMDAGESRIDLITANTSGTLAAVEGTAATNPDAPDVPSDEVVLGFVVIAESDSTVADSDIINLPVLIRGRWADAGAIDGISESTWTENTSGTALFFGAEVKSDGSLGATGTGEVHVNSSQSDRIVAQGFVSTDGDGTARRNSVWLTAVVPPGHFYKVNAASDTSVVKTIEQEVW